MSDQVEYQIRVQGWMGRRWTNLFNELTIVREQTAEGVPVTILRGPVADQAALRGLLSRLWDLNLTLISVSRLPAGSAGSEQFEQGG